MKIVIITTFHNQERIDSGMVGETIESVRSLKIPEGVDVEYVLFSNGQYQDEKIREQIKDFPFSVYYFHVPFNMGAVNGGNVVVHVALARNADYIQMLDSDDKFHPDYLLEAYARIQQGDVDMVGCYYRTFGNTNEVIEWQEGIDLETIVTKRVAPPFHMLFKRKCLEITGGSDTRLDFCNDWELHLRMAKLGMKYAIIKKELIYYRLHGNQETDGRFRDEEWKNKALSLNGYY